MKVVLAHGTFDLIHYGHVLLFRVARALGDRLIVTLTADVFVAKGPGRPVFNERQRLDWVRSFRAVDEAHIIHAKTGVAAIMRFQPAIYAKGRDTRQWTQVIEEEKNAIESIGGELRYIDTGTVFHSGELLSGRYLEPAKEDQEG
jgi:cytidyltransferase-like protein